MRVDNIVASPRMKQALEATQLHLRAMRLPSDFTTASSDSLSMDDSMLDSLNGWGNESNVSPQSPTPAHFQDPPSAVHPIKGELLDTPLAEIKSTNTFESAHILLSLPPTKPTRVSRVSYYCSWVILSMTMGWLVLCAVFQVPPLPGSFVSTLCKANLLSDSYFCIHKPGPNLDSSTSQENPNLGRVYWADFPGLVMVQDTITDTFTGENHGASALALQITKAELATSDLIAAIRYSTLRAADQLAESLSFFVQDAVEAADSLLELDAKAMGAIDSILGINTWALRAIEEARSTSSGAMNSLVVWRTKKPSKEIINEKFQEAMAVQSHILTDLVVLAKHSQGQLKRMKERLQAIRDLATREQILINTEHGELLASMWTMLGANQNDLHRFSTNLELLENLEIYTDMAKMHIAQALTNLKTMQAQMKDLRNKVSKPDIAGTSIPVDIHIRTIMDGIQRMKAVRIRAREREGDLRTLGNF